MPSLCTPLHPRLLLARSTLKMSQVDKTNKGSHIRVAHVNARGGMLHEHNGRLFPSQKAKRLLHQAKCEKIDILFFS
jgi:hypothetical protein